MQHRSHIRRCHICGATNEFTEQDVAATCQCCGKIMAPYFFAGIIQELEGFNSWGSRNTVDLHIKYQQLFVELLIQDELLGIGEKPKTNYQPIIGLSVIW